MKVCFISSVCMIIISTVLMCIELLHGDLRGHLHGLLCFGLIIYYTIAAAIFYMEVKKNECRKSLKTPIIM